MPISAAPAGTVSMLSSEWESDLLMLCIPEHWSGVVAPGRFCSELVLYFIVQRPTT